MLTPKKRLERYLEKARLRQAKRREKRREAGEVMIQVWISRALVEQARSEGYRPVVCWSKTELPPRLIFDRRAAVQPSGGAGTVRGAIFVEASE
jgi:hypothetical protein